MAKVSFAKNPGAGQSAPVTQADASVVEEIPATAATTELVPHESPAPAPSNALGFYTGEEDAPETDPRDVRLPRLNLVQGMSGADLKAVAPEGSFVYKQALNLGTTFRAVVIGFRPKTYIEKLPKFGEGEPRIAHTLAEVAAFGGTDDWRSSRENKDKDGVPVSRKPWFPAHVTGLLMIQRPESADDAHFPIVTPDGQAFGLALFTVKSTSFGSFYIPINSELRGLFRGHFANRYIEVSSRQTKAYIPVAKIKEETSEAVRELARKAVS